MHVSLQPSASLNLAKSASRSAFFDAFDFDPRSTPVRRLTTRSLKAERLLLFSLSSSNPQHGRRKLFFPRRFATVISGSVLSSSLPLPPSTPKARRSTSFRSPLLPSFAESSPLLPSFFHRIPKDLRLQLSSQLVPIPPSSLLPNRS